MTLRTLLYACGEDRIATLTLNRPEKLNAFSPELLAELDRVLETFEEDGEASVLVIKGAGRAFSSGYDLTPRAEGAGGAAFSVTADRAGLRRLTARWQRLWDLPKPTIAQVHGFCLAGAVELVGHCDLVVAADDAQFGHPAARSLGVIPTLGLWPYLIGVRKTKELLFTGDLMSAGDALAWGLVNRVTSRAELDTETIELARRIASVPLDLLALHKAAANRFVEIMGLRAAEQAAADLDALAHQTPAVAEWMREVREKGVKRAVAARDRRPRRG
jgi:enoyl-CoA hydratase